jgi:hypothetical protein
VTNITLTTDFGIRNDFGCLGISVVLPGFGGESGASAPLSPPNPAPFHDKAWRTMILWEL